MNDGSIGQLLFYAAEHSKTKLFPSGSTTNLVSWNIHRDSSQASSVIMASEVNQVMAPPIGYSKQLVQPKPFWALSSRCEYGSGSFFATALETVTNSHVETAGQYSFKGARDWYELFMCCFYIIPFLTERIVLLVVGAFLSLS